jgi:hypothetical protein
MTTDKICRKKFVFWSWKMKNRKKLLTPLVLQFQIYSLKLRNLYDMMRNKYVIENSCNIHFTIECIMKTS